MARSPDGLLSKPWQAVSPMTPLFGEAEAEVCGARLQMFCVTERQSSIIICAVSLAYIFSLMGTTPLKATIASLLVWRYQGLIPHFGYEPTVCEWSEPENTSFLGRKRFEERLPESLPSQALISTGLSRQWTLARFRLINLFVKYSGRNEYCMKIRKTLCRPKE